MLPRQRLQLARLLMETPLLMRAHSPDPANDAPRSKLRGITEHSFEDFSETELNPVASYGEYSSSSGGKCQ